MAEGEDLTWRELFEKHHVALLGELGARMEADLRQAREQASAVARAEGDLRVAEVRAQSELEIGRVRAEAELQLAQVATDAERRVAEARVLATTNARLSAAEALHQAIRRLRQSSGEVQVLKVLNEISTPWAPQSVVLVFENHQARGVALRGVAVDEVQFDVASAPAVLSVIETRDPVIALLSARELSGPLASALGVEPGSRAHLFPVLVRQSVVAILVASGEVSAQPLELLTDAAALRLEALTAPPPPPPGLNQPGLVQIDAKVAAITPAIGGAPDKTAWEDLSADEQRLHLQAQRMARVRTAEMRLYNSDDLQRGTTAGDIYGALQAPIDSARAEFLQTYLSKSSTMVDYLHLEILRTLAHDDDRLLGSGYPGPMV